jgi:segregation and condensation protein B
MMDLKREAAIIESVLFLETEPVDPGVLARKTGLEPEVVRQALELIREEYRAEVHGLELVEIGGGYTFAPKAALWEILKPLYARKNDNRLSRAAMETLSIIAYSQPVTRAEIESIRGVAADGMIKLLLSRNMIKEVGRKDAPGRPTQYGTTREFLQLFRLSSIADLPKLDEVERDRFEVNE